MYSQVGFDYPRDRHRPLLPTVPSPSFVWSLVVASAAGEHRRLCLLPSFNPGGQPPLSASGLKWASLVLDEIDIDPIIASLVC